jgi:DNA-binding NarL/FixJ family response regulator
MFVSPVPGGVRSGSNPGPSSRTSSARACSASLSTTRITVARPQCQDPAAEPTDREREVLRLVAAGKANKEIAAELVISEPTARTHVSNILRKLGLASRTQAALWAVREGLADEP